MRDEHDSDLRKLFSAAREQETPRAPEFRPLWERALRRDTAASASWHRGVGLALAASLIAGIGLSLRWRDSGRSPAQSVTASEATITEWRASTDFLMQTPATELWTTVPEIGETGRSMFAERDLPPAKP